MTLSNVKMTFCNFDIVEAKKSHFDFVTANNLITALFNTTKILLKHHLTPKNLILVSFNTEKYIKSCEFSQVVIYKVTTALKDIIPRNIVEASFKLNKYHSSLIQDHLSQI
jgi:hypothetical protein